MYGIVDGVDRASLDAMIALELESWADTRPTVAFLVTRQDPLRIEGPDERWRKLSKTYEDLGQEQADHYTVEKVHNGASIDQALEFTLRVFEREHGP